MEEYYNFLKILRERMHASQTISWTKLETKEGKKKYLARRYNKSSIL